MVHWDRQLHRPRWWSLGLLSCVGALLNWHQPPSFQTKAFFVSLKNKGPLWGACDQLPGQFDYISPCRRIVDQARAPFCVESPFQIFQGQELNWILLSFETPNNVLTVKRASASVFFTLALIKSDNGENGLEWFLRSSNPSPTPSLPLSCSTPIKCLMYSGCSRCTNRRLAAPTCWRGACREAQMNTVDERVCNWPVWLLCFICRFEKYNKDGETLYATVGYMTVYNYYVYPDKTRPRVR